MPQTDPRKRTLGAGAAPAAATGAPAQGAQQAVPAAAAAPPTPAAQTAQAPAGTGFVNLATVLAANRSGAQQMGQQLAGDVRQRGQQAQQAIQQGQAAFQGATTAATLTYNPLEASKKGNAAQLAGTTYAGPKDWAAAGVDVAGLAKQAADAQDRAGALTSHDGRAALLREKAPGLTAGGANMDAFLAGQGMGAEGQEVASSFGSLVDQLRAGREGAAGQYEAASRATADAAGRYGALTKERAAADAQAEAEREQQESVQHGQEQLQRESGRRLQDGQWTQEEAMQQEEIKRRGARRYEDWP